VTLTLVGTPTTFVASANSVASEFPGGYSVTADDLACLVVMSKHRTETNGPSEPSGWVQIGTGLGGITGSGVDQGKIRITVFERVLQAGDTAPSVGQQGGQGNFLAAAIYVFRKSAAGTYETVLDVLSEETAGTSWSEVMAGVPDWLADDHLVLPSGARTDSVTGFAVGTLTATGLTISTITEDFDAGTTQGDDARLTSARATVTAGPPTVAPTRAVTITGTSSAGAMGILRVRHVSAGADATVSATVVAVAASVPSVLVSTGEAAAAFIVGSSLVAGVDQLGVGGTTDEDAWLFPLVIAARVTIPPPLLWGPPSGLTATPLSSSAIQLNWNAVLAATGYDVERDGARIAQDVTGTQYNDTDLAASTEYDYRVRAVR
jgi:hypothetical protein